MKSTFSKILLASLLTFGLHGADAGAAASGASAKPTRYISLQEINSTSVGFRGFQIVGTDTFFIMKRCLVPGCESEIKACSYAFDTKKCALAFLNESNEVFFRSQVQVEGVVTEQ